MRIVEGGIGKGGRDRAHRPSKTVPVFPPLSEHPPDWLPREAKAEWRRLLASWKYIPEFVERPDRAAMIAMCLEWDKYVTAARDIIARGHLVPGYPSKGPLTIRNPSCIVANDALNKLHVMWQRFGMTPGDRARFNLDKGMGEDDPLLKLLTGGGTESD